MIWQTHFTVLSLVGCVLGAVACSGPLGPEQNQLDQALSLWRESEITSYSYRFQRLCFCPSVDPVIIEVEEEQIIAITDEGSGQPATPPSVDYYLTIDGIFAAIHDAIEQGAHSLTAIYHPTLGYPTAVDIDYLENAIDEEMSYRASRLVQR